MLKKIIFLGTGTSQGIPIIGCHCPVCQSLDPRDRRLRTSVLLETAEGNILIDATPELRLQCLENQVRRVDVCLMTHTHADHIFGLDDLRRYSQLQGGPINIYAAPGHIQRLEMVYSYARADRSRYNPDLPQFWFNELTPGQAVTILGQNILPLELPHGRGRVTGYRIDKMAYCTDLSSMPAEVREKLQGLDLLVLGALRPQPHPAHLSLEQAYEIVSQLGPRRTYLVHMAHQISHAAYENLLPPGIFLAHDRLQIEI